MNEGDKGKSIDFNLGWGEKMIFFEDGSLASFIRLVISAAFGISVAGVITDMMIAWVFYGILLVLTYVFVEGVTPHKRIANIGLLAGAGMAAALYFVPLRGCLYWMIWFLIALFSLFLMMFIITIAYNIIMGNANLELSVWGHKII